MRFTKRGTVAALLAAAVASSSFAAAFALPAGGAVTAAPKALLLTRLHASTYIGYAMDECHLPPMKQLNAWKRSPFHALNIYIGGINEGCPQHVTVAWVRAATDAGWRLIPTYVSLQATHPTCGCVGITPRQAYAEGAGAGNAAARDMRAIGLGRGNIVYDDMEGYTRGYPNTPAVLEFLNAWTHALHNAGYLSGVYSSASSGIADLVREAALHPRGYRSPDDIWIADWNGTASLRDRYVPQSFWTHNTRIHQFRGNVTLRYGGVALAIDEDFSDGAVVATAGRAIPIP